jgi:flagellar biogenesis protein FliO
MINFTDLSASLDIMWKGMVGLFAVCTFIMLLIMLISKFMGKTKRKQEQ